MALKSKISTALIVVLIVILAIVSFSTGLFGESKITSPMGSNPSTPTIVAPQSAEDGNKLTWDCPGAGGCGGG